VKGILMIRPLTSVAVLAVVGVLAACGSDDPSGNATDAGTAGAQTSAGPGGGTQAGGPGGGRFPGAFGEIAAVQGKTLQVQNPQTGQVAVTYDARTRITQEVDAALSDVTVGSCVVVGSDSNGPTGSAGSATGTATDAVVATSVRISQPTDGSCQAGIGGDGGALTGAPPSELPSGAPSGAPSDGTRAFGGAFGQVTAVSAGGFSVQSVRPGSSEEQTVSVSVSSDTTYSTEAAAQSSALKVGRCVQATGDADATGAITATRIAVSDKVDGQCGGGLGGFARPTEQTR
jgi:hypothetical protein